MPDQDTQTKTYPLINKGAVTKLDPALLSPGQLLTSINTTSLVEGQITSRPGRLLLGNLPNSALNPNKICKLSIPSQIIPISNATNATPIVITTAIPHGWRTGFYVSIQGVTGNASANVTDQITVLSPTSFSLVGTIGSGGYVNGGVATLMTGDPSLRYIGSGSDIWRTNDFFATGSFTQVNSASVMVGLDPFITGWSMASYSAGATGNPVAYFATPGFMLKDYGTNPLNTLASWGITQALAAASAVNAAGTSIGISGAAASGTLIEITTSGAHGFSTGETVTNTGIVGTTEANGTFLITVIDGTHFTLNNSTFVNAYVSGGETILAGPDSTQPGATPYDYVYTFRDPSTGDEGNPSVFMDSSLAVASQDGLITVTMWGSPDPKITGAQSIVLYRRGGSFADGIFRQVGYATNPGVSGSGVPLSVKFIDTTPDIGLVYVTNQAEFDNFPPVVSTLRMPINSTISSGNPNLSPGWVILTLSSPIQNILTVGSSLIIGSSSGASTSNQETVAIAGIPQPSTGANTTILVYLQLEHVAGEPVQIGSVAGQSCSLTVAAFDTLFVAGDPNNPQTLYQSKTGRPEAFPIVDSLGNSHSINVGTPSNGIQNICEFRGSILCMNISNLFTVDVFQGVMYGPNATPCERGLVAPWAWCKSENVIYYLAYDGIWSWDGSRSKKVSEAIDTVFNGGQPVAFNVQIGFPPLVQSAISQCRMEYYRNQLFFLYLGFGEPRSGRTVLRYDTLYDRWTQEIHQPFSTSLMHSTSISTFFNEVDLGYFIFGRSIGGVTSIGGVFSQYNAPSTDSVGYSDEYTDAGTGLNGDPFTCVVQPGFFRPEDFTRIKLFQDFLVECQVLQVDSEVTVNLYYDYSTTVDPVDQFTIEPPTTARTTYPLPLQLSGAPALPAGKEAFAVSPQISWQSTVQASFNSIGFRYLDRDAVQAGMASDWMNLGTNNDKRVYQIHLEHMTNNVIVKLHMDIRYGINGVLQANDVAVFQIQSSDKTTVTLPVPETGFPDNLTICKSIRLRPEYYTANATPETSIGQTFRIFFKPSFDFETYPPDQVLFTPWKNFGYQCEKLAKVLMLDCDTGGVQASIQAQVDGVNIGAPFLVNTTANDRQRNLPFGSNPQAIGKLWRLTSLPGAGGKAQIFDWAIDYSKEPCQVTFIDTYEQAFGYDGFKFLKQIWLEYACPVPIILTILADYGNILFSIQLPAHPNRDVERFYIPESNAPIIGTVNTNGEAVTWVSGAKFDPAWGRLSVIVGAVTYVVNIIPAPDADNLTLTNSAGVQVDVPYGIFTTGTVYALNKSRQYRFQVASTTTAGFKLYADASRFEWAGTSDQQRAGYRQSKFSELMKIPA